MPRSSPQLEEEFNVGPTAPGVRHLSAAPVAVEVAGVSKSFALRGAAPLRALRDISFEVHRGEFFGIVGRNGSGKSTLLKLLASIYRVDEGRIRVAGRLAPFIELGVGFDTELTARENAVISGVIGGLGRREAACRLDAVLEFAELEEFVDLKLKNYSSGMLVRLAFATLVEAQADVMLIDEVLAVGDAAFAEKCLGVFRAKRDAGATIVLVTHDMATVQSFCDRAMLLHNGAQRFVGAPDEAARRYYRLNFNADAAAQSASAVLVDAWVEVQGRRTEVVAEGRPVGVELLVEARETLSDSFLDLRVVRDDGVLVCGFGADECRRVPAGRRARVSGRLDAPLMPGTYTLEVTMTRSDVRGDLALHAEQAARFEVVGRHVDPASAEDRDTGLVRVANDVRVRRVGV